MLNVVCVQVQNYLGLGPEYVNKLYRAVCHNSTVPLRFVCFTDTFTNVGNYTKGIDLRLAPKGLRGWYYKLMLFKEGLFPAGDRIVFLDLDTVITGNIDPLLQYDGEFAILQDFMDAKRYGPGVMAWRADTWPALWQNYEAAGFPTHLDLGDLTWINDTWRRAGYKPDVLQDIMNGVYSYRIHCKAGLPADARIICFHGLPRPHQVRDTWMGRHWNGRKPENCKAQPV